MNFDLYFQLMMGLSGCKPTASQGEAVTVSIQALGRIKERIKVHTRSSFSVVSGVIENFSVYLWA